MKDSFKEIMKKVEIRKAPKGFAERIMFHIGSEASPITSDPLSNDLLSKKQRIFLLLLVLSSFISIYFFLSYKSNPENLAEEPIQRWNFVQLIAEKLALIIHSSDITIFISALTFVFISYFILDLAIRKGLKLSF